MLPELSLLLLSVYHGGSQSVLWGPLGVPHTLGLYKEGIFTAILRLAL